MDLLLKLKIRKIRKEIEKSQKPIMFYDCDCDGATSYLQLKSQFPKIKGFPLKKDKEKQLKLIEDNITKHTDLILIFDIPFLYEEFLEKIKDKKIILVDHHQTTQKKLIKKYKIQYLNPLNYNKNDNRPCTYLSYLIANKKENLPLATLGSVSDFFLLDLIIELEKYNKEEFDTLFKIDDKTKQELFKFIKKYKFNHEKTRSQREKWIRYLTYNTNLIEIKNLFDFAFKLKKEEDVIKAIKIFEKISIKEIKLRINIEEGFLFEDYAILSKEYKKLRNKALKEKPTKNMLFFEYSGKVSFTKTLSEELCNHFENTQIIGVCFINPKSPINTCSFRGNNYNVNDLVVNSIKNLDGNGGGHPFAAGMMVTKKDYEKFKKNLNKIVN